jgi:DNA invertase Pin-like site-specific DNA recombinase
MTSAPSQRRGRPKTAKALNPEAPTEPSAVRPHVIPLRKIEGEQTQATMTATLLQRAAIYARVSTHSGQDPEMQLRELREYCARRGWNVAGEYVDCGISGSTEHRPQLDRLLIACRKRQVDAVVVYRYDRFARSLRQLVNALEEFRSLGIDFVSLHEDVDTSTPNGRLVFGIFATIAEFERELIRDRVRSGLASARAKGKRLGRPRADVNSGQIARLRDSGASWRAVARRLGISVRTARRAALACGKNPSAEDALNA